MVQVVFFFKNVMVNVKLLSLMYLAKTGPAAGQATLALLLLLPLLLLMA